MLKLLLDEHISPAVATGLRRVHSKLTVHPMNAWESGAFLGQSAPLILSEAYTQKLTFVTYDLKTVPPLLKSWAQDTRPHAGVIFVDEKTIVPSDIGGLVRALSVLIEQCGKEDWNNRILFLQSGAEIPKQA